MPSDSSPCVNSKNDTFKSDIVSAGPEFLKERTPNTSMSESNSNVVTPADKIFNIGRLELFRELESSPLMPGPGKKLKDMPHTTTLKGCVAYVDVWSSDATDNRSSVYRNFLKRMGATAAPKFTKEQPITHLVFKDGHKSALQKAIKRNVKIVSPLWVDSCRQLQQWIDEDEFKFDPTDYKPPKKFREMQPLEPEEMLRRSAESLKRRQARFAKKKARIQFQSPLVTNCIGGDWASKYSGVLAADTPFVMPSLARYLSPSIIQETPMTDSMMRKIQRYKEGKRILSPPSSDHEQSDKEDVTEVEDSKSKDPVFSPVPETQRPVDKSWMESGLSQPKFDESYEEVPDTQQSVAPDTPEKQQEPVRSSCNGVSEIPETQRLSLSASDACHEILGSPLFKSTSRDNSADASTTLEHLTPRSKDVADSMGNLRLHVSHDSFDLEEVPTVRLGHGADARQERRNSETGNKSEKSNGPKSSVDEIPETPSFTPTSRDYSADSSTTLERSTPSSKDVTDSMSSLRLHASRDSFDLEDIPTVRLGRGAPAPEGRKKLKDENITKDNDRPKTKRGKKKRRLICGDGQLEPMSVLLSPQDDRPRRRSRRSLALPQLGYSAFKNLKKSGKYFDDIVSSTSDESLTTPVIPDPGVSPTETQSTDFGESDNDCFDGGDAFADAVTPLGLYDRVKTKRRVSTQREDASCRKDLATFYADPPPPNKRQRLNAASGTPPRIQVEVTTVEKHTPAKSIRSRKSTQFLSQAANAIIRNSRRRRSTLDFLSPNRRTATPRRDKKSYRVVLTNFHSEERSKLHRELRRFPCYALSPVVTDETSHVVCGEARRTLNVLKAVVFGSWLLSSRWITDSISAGLWLEEDSYEIDSLFPGARRNRLKRAEDPTWRNELFHDFEGRMYVASQTRPDPSDMRELISWSGGTVAGSVRGAAICIGNPGRRISIPAVQESWILDCICENELKPTESYLIEVT